MPPERQNPLDRFILYQYRIKPEWQYLEKGPKQAYRLENSIGHQSVQKNSRFIHFFCILLEFLKVYLFLRYVFSIILWMVLWLIIDMLSSEPQLIDFVFAILLALPEVWLLARCVLPLICGTVLWIADLTADFKRKR